MFGDIVVIVALLLIVGAIVGSMVKRRREGRSALCTGCPSDGTCSSGGCGSGRDLLAEVEEREKQNPSH